MLDIDTVVVIIMINLCRAEIKCPLELTLKGKFLLVKLERK